MSHVFVFNLFCIFLLLITFSKAKDSVYTHNNALRHLYYAYGSYCNVSSLESWNCKWCVYNPDFEVNTVINKNFLQGYVGFDNAQNQIIVSFRGSYNLPNWVDNFDAVTVKYPNVKGGKVHRGFYESWKLDFSPHVMHAVTTLMNEHKGVSIVINGHSFGGVMTQLAALEIYNHSIQINNPVEIICYTFGSPRWGNKAMAEYFDDRINIHWRITNDRDPVPNAPPRKLGFYHTSTHVWYNDDDKPLKFEECASTNGEDPNCNHLGYSGKDHLRYLNVYEEC